MKRDAGKKSSLQEKREEIPSIRFYRDVVKKASRKEKKSFA